MSRYAFLRTSRWIGLALLAVAVATACVFLGIWQWDRHESRAAANDLVNTNYDRPVAPLEEVVDGPVGADDVWRRVTLSGSYVGDQVLLRNRPVGGTAAARVLAVLRTDGLGTTTEGTDGTADDGGRLVVVDRGLVPLGDGDTVVPEYPSGEVELVARLRQAEAADSRTAPAGQVYAVEPGTVLEATGAGADAAPVLDGYLMAVSEEPAPAQELAAFPRPETTPGSHLSYAFQWWVFALGALVGFVVLARREAAETAGDPVRTDRRRQSDADVEDALIDAQLRKP